MISKIADISHHNKDIDLRKGHSSGLVAVIHKATQGTTFVDPRVVERRTLCRDLNLLFGVYHFGNGEDGARQAQHFLECVGVTSDLVRILDIEKNPSGDTIDLKTAEDFVTAVHQATGIWPGLYSSNFLFEMTEGVQVSPLYSCWLWCSNYDGEPVVPSPWANWILWQYTDGTQGLAGPIDGLGFCDRSKFQGSFEELNKFWKSPDMRLNAS